MPGSADQSVEICPDICHGYDKLKRFSGKSLVGIVPVTDQALLSVKINLRLGIGAETNAHFTHCSVDMAVIVPIMRTVDAKIRLDSATH